MKIGIIHFKLSFYLIQTFFAISHIKSHLSCAISSNSDILYKTVQRETNINTHFYSPNLTTLYLLLVRNTRY